MSSYLGGPIKDHFTDFVRHGDRIGKGIWCFKIYEDPKGKLLIANKVFVPPKGSKFVGLRIEHPDLRPNTLHFETYWCSAFLYFKNASESAECGRSDFELVCESPISIDQSLVCPNCGSKGFVRNGEFEPIVDEEAA